MAFRATRLPSLNQIPRRIEIAFLSSLRNPNPIQNPNNFLLLSPHRLTQSQGGIRASHSLRSHPLAAAMSGEASPSSSAESAKTVRVIVKGRVQGVFYRNWTIENAKELGLRGWVRNRRDGSVEALFSGKYDLVAEMERRCRHGPKAAIVTGIDVFPSSDDPGSGFDRKQTVWENDTSKQPNLKTHRNNENYNDLNTNIMM